LGEHKRAEALENVLRRYEASIRWTSGQQMHNFLPPEYDRQTLKPISRNIRVTHYEVVQGPTMLGEDRAVQTAVIQYVFQDTQRLRELNDKQEWRYDDEAESWYLYSPIPEFK
jgi:hypothetical protein